MSDKKAKDEKEAYDNELSNGNDGNYNDHKDAARSSQRNRSIGIGLAIAGGVGVVLSFVF